MIIINSIHSIRAIQIARQSTFANYFNCNSQTFERFIKIYPFFDKINSYLKNLIESLRELRLDNKEYALFTAYVAFSTSKIQFFIKKLNKWLFNNYHLLNRLQRTNKPGSMLSLQLGNIKSTNKIHAFKKKWNGVKRTINKLIVSIWKAQLVYSKESFREMPRIWSYAHFDWAL